MANPKHLELLRHGIDHWNAWRTEKPSIFPDLRAVNLQGDDLFAADLHGADLREADLRGATLRGANLFEADLRGADLRLAKVSDADLRGARLCEANLCEANLREADLRGADLTGANLTGVDLGEANLFKANLSATNLFGADLSAANLDRAILVEASLVDAILKDCSIYGISAWGIKVSQETIQHNLIITPSGEPQITTDDMEVAQFLSLLLHNEKLQRVIDTVTSKVVLILGRFWLAERKKVLNGLRVELRKPGRNYVPVVFDFEKPRSQNTLNTIMLLARMARFVIADISDAKSVLMELQAIVPSSPRLPVQPIIVTGQEEPGMFDFFRDYPWFLKVHRYDGPTQLIDRLDERVIGPVEAEVAKLRLPRA
jgi:uncharacterized protein YjbI with pentapeptide repeats